MNTRCPPKRVPSAARFFTHCELTVQPPQSYSVGGQRISGQLTGKPASARPDYRGRWCTTQLTTTTPALTREGKDEHTLSTLQTHHAATQDNAALGSLQASPQASGETTGVAGARRPYPGRLTIVSKYISITIQ
ncbi:UNVERIFIED_CONTAM: hypothetical protein FKN15_043634 [Acipenser sinensis]